MIIDQSARYAGIPELNPVGRNKIVRNSLHNARLGLEPVDLRSDHGLRAEVLPVAVAGIREPQVAGVVVLLDVVQAGEVPAVEAVDQHAGLVGGGVDEGEPGGFGQVALVAVDDLLAFAAVGRGADGVEGGAAVCEGELGVADGGDFVVAVDVDGGHVDGVVEGAGPVAGGV